MSLTPAQIARENAFFDDMYKAAEARDGAATMDYFNSDATFTSDQGSWSGVPAIRAYFEAVWTTVENVALVTTARTFDPAQNLVWETSESLVMVKDDPEKKQIKIKAINMMKKNLGVDGAKIDSVVRYADATEFIKRLEELGKCISA